MTVAPSLRTRHLFREHLVSTVLGYIDDVFQAADIPRGIPTHEPPPSQRRARVDEYYAGADWSSDRDVARVIRAFEHILMDVDEGDYRKKLVDALQADGFRVDEAGHVSAPMPLGDVIDAASLVDPNVFRDYERRISESIERDPELAIGSSKELVEATCRLLLDEAGVVPDPGWSAEQLFKQALKTLDLSIDAVPDSRSGAESIRKVLRGLHQSVVGSAELRNRFGTGHGRHHRSSGLGARHARLVASSAFGLTRFLLDTRTEHIQRSSGSRAAE